MIIGHQVYGRATTVVVIPLGAHGKISGVSFQNLAAGSMKIVFAVFIVRAGAVVKFSVESIDILSKFSQAEISRSGSIGL